MSAATQPGAKDFNAVERGGETIWIHESGQVWVVYYPAIEGSQSFQREFWQPYRAIEPLKRGRQPWARNNKRVGKEGEFSSLNAALQAGRDAVTQEKAA